MKKSKIISLLIFLILLVTISVFKNELLNLYSKLSLRLPQIERGFGNFLIKESERWISTPPPLQIQKENPEAFLTQSGVIFWTNVQRQKNGFPPLKENEKLNNSAEAKTKDMFENQYFAHYSPTGLGVKDLAENVGYEFIALGENLALGDFQNDETLLEAWMDSPGHRENILSSRYQEIGVAVEKGIFEGRQTWIAVQHFGLSLSFCPQADEKTKAEIEQNKNQMVDLQKTLSDLKIEIQTTWPKHGSEYNQKIEQYNSFVDQYNNLINETEFLINNYNEQVRLFNECVSGAK
jgi:hypothetical protein